MTWIKGACLDCNCLLTVTLEEVSREELDLGKRAASFWEHTFLACLTWGTLGVWKPAVIKWTNCTNLNAMPSPDEAKIKTLVASQHATKPRNVELEILFLPHCHYLSPCGILRLIISYKSWSTYLLIKRSFMILNHKYNHLLIHDVVCLYCISHILLWPDLWLPCYLFVTSKHRETYISEVTSIHFASKYIR